MASVEGGDRRNDTGQSEAFAKLVTASSTKLLTIFKLKHCVSFNGNDICSSSYTKECWRFIKVHMLFFMIPRYIMFPFSLCIWVMPCDSFSQWKINATLCNFQVWPIEEKKKEKTRWNKIKPLSARDLRCSFPFCLLDVNAQGNLESTCWNLAEAHPAWVSERQHRAELPLTWTPTHWFLSILYTGSVY